MSNGTNHSMILQTQIQESLNENILKAKTLIDLVIVKELLDCPATLMYYYFAAISDFLLEASLLSESILSSLIKSNIPHLQGEPR
ncbi:MAG TPA: hypothetical protein VHE99_04015 [Gammaproteobacteria bacterium]|nr:hypothetical protein [Gammaproteobacteria bacterium]